jgi:hypothetical protein
MRFYIFNSEGSRCQHILCTACPLASEGYLLVHYTLNALVQNVDDFISLSCVEKVFCRYIGMLSVECMLVLRMQWLVCRQFWFLIFMCQYSWNQKLRVFWLDCYSYILVFLCIPLYYGNCFIKFSFYSCFSAHVKTALNYGFFISAIHDSWYIMYYHITRNIVLH